MIFDGINDGRLPKKAEPEKLKEAAGRTPLRLDHCIKKGIIQVEETKWREGGRKRWKRMEAINKPLSYRVRNGAHPSHSSTLHFCDVVFAW